MDAKHSMRRATGTVLAVALAAPLLAGAAHHITPTVVLRKQADVIRATLPDAGQFFLRTVAIGREDLSTIERAGFQLEDAEIRFYLGKSGDDLVGTVLFPQVNTQHGPLEVGLTFGPDGAVRQVTVTNATVETKPWVQRALATGFLAELEGARTEADAAGALTRLKDSDPGKMPEFMGEVALRAVKQGLVLYRTLVAGTGA